MHKKELQEPLKFSGGVPSHNPFCGAPLFVFALDSPPPQSPQRPWMSACVNVKLTLMVPIFLNLVKWDTFLCWAVHHRDLIIVTCIVKVKVAGFSEGSTLGTESVLRNISWGKYAVVTINRGYYIHTVILNQDIIYNHPGLRDIVPITNKIVNGHIWPSSCYCDYITSTFYSTR